MKNEMMRLSVVVLCLSFVACVAEGGDQSGGAPLEPSILQQAVSDCGGFTDDDMARSGGGDYCAAELLHWRYDAATGTLVLLDARAILNCCSERSIWAEVIDGVLVVTEVDDVDIPCRCMCTFDFSISIQWDDEAPLEIELYRTSDETVGPALLWTGTIDLREGAGQEVIDAEDGGSYCE